MVLQRLLTRGMAGSGNFGTKNNLKPNHAKCDKICTYLPHSNYFATFLYAPFFKVHVLCMYVSMQYFSLIRTFLVHTNHINEVCVVFSDT